jgi:lipoprotein-anchoring transpeptidase ErfK/SrfK
MVWGASFALVLGLANPLAPRVGPSALEVQVRLARAHFSPGEIDGRDGANTRAALRAFQEAHGLEPTGAVDDLTWSVLAREPAPPLVEVTLTPGDVEGPFVSIPEDMMEKARLPYLGYRSALERLAETWHASPRLLRELNPRASFRRSGEVVRVPNVATEPPALPAARVVVDGARRQVTAYDGEGRVLAAYPASVGSEHDPLPDGEWNVTVIEKEPPFNYNPDLFWDADESHARARLAPGPNNPVGSVWIDLSREHYGIHGTPEPASVGKTQSHGCIRLTNWDAVQLAALVGIGTPVRLLGSLARATGP